MNLFLYGVVFASSFTAMLFFLKFWRAAKDPLFLFFALSFSLLAVERLVAALLYPEKEYRVYLIRLTAFLLLIVAVIQKNRRR